MKSKKNEELDFLYLDDEHQNTKEKSTVTKKPKKKQTKSKDKKDKFDFNNEIVIGVTKLPSQKEKSNKKKKNSKSRNTSIHKIKTKEQQKGADFKSAPRKKQKINKQKQQSKKSKIVKAILKWIFLFCALIASFIFFMMSPLFNLVEIKVIGNEKITQDTIISLSKVQIGENIYRTSSKKIQNRIKENSYIENVNIKRNLPNKMEIIVKERKTTYLLEYANSFVYLNNQGYILEISEEKLELPIIEGYTTNQEELKVSKRLNQEDLTRLETVLKIMDSANANGIGNLITRFNISNKQEYKLLMENEKKQIYLGDASNLSTKMLYLKAVLEDSQGLEGEIFINGDFNKEKAFFRQKE